MDRLQRMAVFVAVAEEESFSAAARRLGMSPPAVTRAITALEGRLGVRLLNRTTRFVRATEAGRRYLDDARRILAEVDEADDVAAGIHGEPRGHLGITAPVLFGKMFVMPGIVEFLQRHPGIQVSALFLDRVVNLLEEGLDVAIRIGDLPDSSMNALRVAHVRRVVCAAPAYLARHGTPRKPEDLSKHRVVATSAVSATTEWKFVRGGKSCSVRVKPRLTVSTNDAALEAAREGLGVTRLLSYQVATLLATDELKIVLAEFEPPHLPIHVVHREGRHGSAKTRAFVDLMARRLREDAALH